METREFEGKLIPVRRVLKITKRLMWDLEEVPPGLTAILTLKLPAIAKAGRRFKRIGHGKANGGLLGMAVKVPGRKHTQCTVLAVGRSDKIEPIRPVLSNFHGARFQSRSFRTVSARRL
jgi:hypothetical protein